VLGSQTRKRRYTYSLTWKKLSQCGGEKTTKNRSIMW
jgi:hypothetical protein